jgi:DNA-binding transcriptional LysR family regulator
MELRQLRYFLAVAEELNFHRAAERLHIAQPALSQQIRRFERELHTPLFHRTTRRTELTESGKVLYESARRVLAEADNAVSAVRQASHGELGNLRVGFVSSAALALVPKIVHAMRDRWPRLHLDLEEATTEKQLEAIDAGIMDLGIVREVTAPAGLSLLELVQEPLLVGLPRAHPLANRSAVHLAELAGEKFVLFPRNRLSRLYDHVAALCQRAGFRMQASQHVTQFPTMLGLVAAGTGIAIVPRSLRYLQLPGVTFIPIEDRDAVSHIGLVCREDRTGQPPISNFLKLTASLDLASI